MDVLIADMQAGLEHLSWAGGTLRDIDRLLVVAEPQLKSLTTAARTIRLADELGIATVELVGNRLLDGDRDRLQDFAAEHAVELIATIPEDAAVRDADRAGSCLLDHAPSSPAARALEQLADRLLGVRPRASGETTRTRTARERGGPGTRT